MIFLLLLPVLTAGYFTSVHHPYVRLSSAREEGQRLYLRAVSLGFASLAVGGVLAFSMSIFLPDEIIFQVRDLPNSAPTYHSISLDLDTQLTEALVENGILEKSGNRQPAWLLILSATTFLGAGLLVIEAYIRYGHRAGVFANWPANSDGSQQRSLYERLRTWIALSKQSIKLDITAELLEQSPMDRILFRAQMTQDPLQFWMKNRKMYVGWVIDSAEPISTMGTSSEVTILPVMSGYQDEQTLQVAFTTFYLDQGQEVELILRQDEILTVSPFDWTTFNALKPGADVASERKSES